MLSEKQLEKVQGGWVITLSGIVGFVGAVVGGAIFGGGGGSYEAHDSMGHYGHVEKVEAKVKPTGFGKIFDVRHEDVTVLNSDNMRDLQGGHLTLGITSSLPPVIQAGIDKTFGVKGQYFALVTPPNAGAEISIPIINSKGIQENALISVTASNCIETKIPTGNGFAVTGVEVYAGVSATKVTVDKTDRMENYCYAMTHPSKDGK